MILRVPLDNRSKKKSLCTAVFLCIQTCAALAACLGEYVVIKNIAVSLHFLSVLIKIYHKIEKILGKYIFSKCFVDKFSVLTAYLTDISELFTLDRCRHDCICKALPYELAFITLLQQRCSKNGVHQSRPSYTCLLVIEIF